MILWNMDVDTAIEFYKRCMERNAETEEERVEILTELAEEGRINCVSQTNRTPEQVAEDMSKNYGNTLFLRADGEHDVKGE